MKNSMMLSGLVAMLALFMAGCATFNAVNVSRVGDVDFRNAYHSFQWLPDTGDTLNTAFNNEIIRGNIHSVVVNEMRNRNVKLATSPTDADLLLQLVVQNNDRASDNTRYMPGFMFGPFGGGYSSNRSYYNHTRITLNMYEQKTKRLVWSGTAEGDLSRAKDLSNNIQPAVAKILKQYPVPSTQS